VSRTGRFERKGRAMHVSHRGIGRLLLVAVAVAAIGVSGAQAGSKPEPSAELMAIHWKHEDAVYGSRQKTPQTQTAAAQLRAAHWKHEDALYRVGGSTSGSQRSATTDIVAAGDGFGRGEAWSGAGGAVALIILGSAATIVIRRRHSRFAQS
jgi:hypothetical protein